MCRSLVPFWDLKTPLREAVRWLELQCKRCGSQIYSRVYSSHCLIFSNIPSSRGKVHSFIGQSACGWRRRWTHNNELILLSNMQDNINIDTDNYINIVSNIPYYKIFSNSSPGVSCLGCWPPVAWSLLAGRAAWAELTWLYCIWSLIFLMFLNCLKIRL